MEAGVGLDSGEEGGTLLGLTLLYISSYRGGSVCDQGRLPDAISN